MSRTIHAFLPGIAALSLLPVQQAHAGGPTQASILFVTDPDLDRIFDLRDYDHDNTYNGPTEVRVLYDDTLGVVHLSDPDCLTQSPDDTIYVGDSTEDILLWINDGDKNGDANDPSEHGVFFDGKPGGNAAGVRMEHVNGVAVRFLGVVWIANSSTTAAEHSSIIRLEDHNSDLDANDDGGNPEAIEYFVPAPGGAVGDSVPSAVKVGNDGNVYYLENSTTGFLAKGVYKLVDANFNGVIDPGEVSAFFIPTAQALTADLTSLEQDDNGRWYVGDHANEIIWRAIDFNMNGVINPATEAGILWTLPAGSDVHDLAVTGGGELYVGDASDPDSVTAAFDLTALGVIDPGETLTAYSDLISPVNIDRPHGLALDFHDHEGVGEAYCFGDSGLCPCDNLTKNGGGCGNSLDTGAVLEADGTDGVANDNLFFFATGVVPGAPAILLQGSLLQNGGFGVPFGDGLLCVGGSIIRLGLQYADASGEIQWAPPHAAQGGWLAGQTRYFQARYRNVNGPCASNFNTTNGLVITFTQ